MAAALWKGGISFGGVVAFIYADLITFPLLVIYRNYFGRKLMLRILVSFWLVMSLGGLVVYTAVLNVIFLAIFAVLYYLHRNKARFGGGVGYAIDPVCGMQVEIASAPARTTYGGRTQHFCSDRCCERFERRTPHGGGPVAASHTADEMPAAAQRGDSR